MPQPTVDGHGVLRFGGVGESVAYTLGPKRGRAVRRGSLSGDPQTLRAAFRAGLARLDLADGVALSIQLIAHTEGGAIAYFEFA